MMPEPHTVVLRSAHEMMLPTAMEVALSRPGGTKRGATPVRLLMIHGVKASPKLRWLGARHQYAGTGAGAAVVMG
jgi:hypothetical protein